MGQLRLMQNTVNEYPKVYDRDGNSYAMFYGRRADKLATLLVAAPEMVEALKKLLDVAFGGKYALFPDEAEAVDLARAALPKALGQGVPS